MSRPTRSVASRTREGTSPPRTAPIPSSINKFTPVKNSISFADSRKEIEASSKCQDTSIDEDFLSNHLNKPTKSLWSEADAKLYIKQIKKGGSVSDKLYGPLSSLLDKYSKCVHDNLPKHLKRQNVYHFVDYHTLAPLNHPFRWKDRPDILVVEGTSRANISYCKVVSIIECKPVKEDGRPQETSYMSLHMDARPDMPGVYGLWARPQCYQVLWSDAAGVIASPQCKWDDCSLLEGYVYSLYDPPKGHILFDSTIIRSTSLPEKWKKAHWTIKGHLKDPYVDCHWISIGSSWGRRTNVWMQEIEGKGPVVVKDAYRDNKRQYEEEKLLEKIHRKGVFPGVVRTLEAAEKHPQITTAPFTEEQRTKTRLVMGSYGESLRGAESVKDLLMAVYDIVEVHRKLVMDSRILHRDISLNNVRMYPKHNSDALNSKALVSDPPVFIKEVLGEAGDIEGPDKSTGLLIDFDNGADLGKRRDAHKELAFRTGTPRYIARSVAAGKLLRSTPVFYPMPTLDGNAKDLYIAAYNSEDYDRYSSDNGVDVVHGSKYTRSRSPQTQFVHRPDHDVESIYWVLFYVLITAQPKEDSEDWDKTENEETYWCFRNHVIRKGSSFDSRNTILTWMESQVESVLHPQFASLAPMLYEMGCQIAPEYAYLDEPPPKDHLHEAMRRILLRFILEMKDEIKLVPKKEPWEEEEQEEQEEQGPRGSKRKAPEAGGRSQGSKRSKSMAEEHPQRRLSSQKVTSKPTGRSRGASRSQHSNGKSTRGGTSKASTRGSQRGDKSMQTKSQG